MQDKLSKDIRNLTPHFDKPTASDSGVYICKAHTIICKDVRLFLITIDARDCSGYRGIRASGIYTINPDGKQTIQVFCDVDTSNGG